MKDDQRIFYIIGERIDYSFSPLIYNWLFRREKVAASYHLVDLHEGQLEDFINSVKLLGIAGFNVTTPYKQAVVKYLPKLDKIAKATGSVNMVMNRNGLLSGYNTDYYGIRESIEKGLGFKVRNARVAIVGSGGAAQTVYYYVVQKKASRVVVYHHSSRREKQFCTFARELPLFDRYESVRFRNKVALQDDCDLCINCTPIAIDRLLPKNMLSGTGKILELRYGDFSLLGGHHLSGNLMLAVQAARNFKIMAGKEMQVEVIERLIRRFLKR